MVERLAPRFKRPAGERKLVNEEQAPTTTSKLYEITTKVVLPIGLAVVGIVHAQVRFLLYLGPAVLVLAYFPDLLRVFRRIRDFLHDRAVVRRESRELRSFSTELGQFLSANRNDTLHNIVQSFKQNSPSLAGFPLMPEMGVFGAHWQFINGRIAQGGFSTSAFHEVVEEFSALLRGYANYCVQPIFTRFAAEMRSEAKEHDRSQLNGFQQRFARLATDYMRLVERLNVELRTVAPFTIIAVYYPPPL